MISHHSREGQLLSSIVGNGLVPSLMSRAQLTEESRILLRISEQFLGSVDHILSSEAVPLLGPESRHQEPRSPRQAGEDLPGSAGFRDVLIPQ